MEINGYPHQIRRQIITQHARNGQQQPAHGLSVASSLPVGRQIQTHSSGYMESLDAEKQF
jgi:hypothetical protein